MEATSKLRDKRVLVTGATGFIGANMCRRLASCHAEVHGVSRIKQSRTNDSAEWWQTDLSDIEATRRLLRTVHPDFVCHLAGLATGSRSLEAVLPTLENNLVATVNLLVAASEVGCSRLLLAGSLEEPDELDGKTFPCSPYAAAKWASSGYARMFHALYKMPVTVARIFMVYGPGDPNRTRLVPYVIEALLQGETPKLASGVRLVDWIYVDDVVNGLLAMLSAPGIEGRTIDLGSGTLTSIHDLVMQVIDLTGSAIVPAFGARPDPPFERTRVAAAGQTHRLIGWRAETPLREGLERTVSAYKERLQAVSCP